MDIMDIIRLLLILKIKKRLPLHVHLVHMHAYRRTSFGLCNAPTTFQRCIMHIFSDYVERIYEVFMDDFMVYGDSFDKFLENLSLLLKRCIETKLVLNYEKYCFMV
jgi:hypothetical protein